MEEAKKIDKKLKDDMKKANPPKKKASLAQEEPMSLEDQQE